MRTAPMPVIVLAVPMLGVVGLSKGKVRSSMLSRGSVATLAGQPASFSVLRVTKNSCIADG